MTEWTWTQVGIWCRVRRRSAGSGWRRQGRCGGRPRLSPCSTSRCAGMRRSRCELAMWIWWSGGFVGREGCPFLLSLLDHLRLLVECLDEEELVFSGIWYDPRVRREWRDLSRHAGVEGVGMHVLRTTCFERRAAVRVDSEDPLLRRRAGEKGRAGPDVNHSGLRRYFRVGRRLRKWWAVVPLPRGPGSRVACGQYRCRNRCGFSRFIRGGLADCLFERSVHC
jgi:hypothetical protein